MTDSVEMEKYGVGTSSPIGRALLINMKTFMNDSNDESTRYGSEKDMESLRSVLGHLQFEVLEKTDITKIEIIEAVQLFAKDLNDTPVDISCVCIMSHGDKDYLKSHDGKRIHLEEDILDKFSNSNCRGMRKHPKMFLFQSCRGENTETMRDAAAKPSPKEIFTSTLRDAIIAFSTVPGFVSYRDRKNSSSLGGAWFIQAFCKVFGKATTDKEVTQLFKFVSKELSKMQTTAHEKQTMEVTYRSFEKDLFLIPLNAQVPDPDSSGWVKAWEEKPPLLNEAKNTNLFTMVSELELQRNIAQSSYKDAIETYNQTNSKSSKKIKEAVDQVTRTWNVLREAWQQLLNGKIDLGIIIKRISQEDFIAAELEFNMIMINH